MVHSVEAPNRLATIALSLEQQGVPMGSPYTSVVFYFYYQMV